MELPRNSHTGIVHCLSHAVSVTNLVLKTYYSRAISSSSLIVKNIFYCSVSLSYQCLMSGNRYDPLS